MYDPPKNSKGKLETARNSSKANLYDYPPAAREELLAAVVQPAYRAKQISEWVARGAASFAEMSNVPGETRALLEERFELTLPAVKKITAAAPDSSQKYLFELPDGNLIESVYMPMGERTSICLSSQAGCAVGCTFCVTGFFGAGRNLTVSEMVGQYLMIRKDKALSAERMNVVFMGMGEPLLNFDNVVTTMQILERDMAWKRMTLSTSGIIPGIQALAKLPQRPNLAVSINAPDQQRREQIMPITKKYPLKDLMAALRSYPLDKGRYITAEYVLLAGFNDSTADAEALIRLLRAVPVKVNLIPFNEDPNLPEWMKRPTDKAIDRFADVLAARKVPITVRRSKGRDIAAACGQLRGKTDKRPKADERRTQNSER